MIDRLEQYLEEVKERLAKIAFYLEQRDSNRRQLSIFHASDFGVNKELQVAIQRLMVDDENTLSELFHLREGVERYFTARGSELDTLKTVTELKEFKIIASFVNTVKHGTHGKGRLSTRAHGVVIQTVARDSQPSPSDSIRDVRLLINHDGELIQASELVTKVINAWIVLFEQTAKNPFKGFEVRIKRLKEKTTGLAVYQLVFPENLSREARVESEARRNIERPTT